MKKVFIFGLDGADTFFIDKWKDYLPNISALIDNGAYGILESTLPYSTLPAWPCFATSMNPGKLGFMGFTKQDDSGKTTIVDSSLHKEFDIWTILSNKGYNVIVINVPSTYPPYPVNGIIASGLLTPPGANFTYPTDLKHEFNKISKGYIVEPIITSPNEMKGGEKAFNDEVMLTFKKRESVIKHLINKYEWNFFMVVYRVLDIVQHKYLHESDYDDCKEIRDYEMLKKDKIYMWYKAIDDSLGETIKLLPSDTYKILMSDHGCFPAYPTFYINEWLINENFLFFNEHVNIQTSTKKDNKSKIRSFVIQHVPTGLLHLLMKYVPSDITKKLKTVYMSNVDRESFNNMVDWKKTQVFASLGGGNGLFINPNMDDGVKKKILCTIENKLNYVYHPNGVKIIFKKWRIKNIYWGNKMNNFPDLLIKAYAIDNNDNIIGECRLSGALRGRLWGDTPHPGVHRREGMYLVSGPGIKKIRKQTSILNITPTILKIFNIEKPNYMDGKEIEDIFI